MYLRGKDCHKRREKMAISQRFSASAFSVLVNIFQRISALSGGKFFFAQMLY